MRDNYVDDPASAFDAAESTATGVKDKVTETANKVMDNVQEVGRDVRDKVDDSRRPAAEGLQKAASTLHEKAGSLPGGERVAGVVHDVADTMQSTAEYVRSHDVRGMMSDVGALVRRYPGQSLLAAVAAGFLVGTAITGGARGRR